MIATRSSWSERPKVGSKTIRRAAGVDGPDRRHAYPRQRVTTIGGALREVVIGSSFGGHRAPSSTHIGRGSHQGFKNDKAPQSRGLSGLRGEDLNLRPSGYEEAASSLFGLVSLWSPQPNVPSNA